MTLNIGFDFESTVPIWRQLHDALADKTASGELPAGYRLAPVRQLAAELQLAPGTVARVYRDLETAGVVETRGRHGTFVASGAREVRDEAERAHILDMAATQLVIAARQVGATEAQAVKIFREHFRSNS